MRQERGAPASVLSHVNRKLRGAGKDSSAGIASVELSFILDSNSFSVGPRLFVLIHGVSGRKRNHGAVCWIYGTLGCGWSAVSTSFSLQPSVV